MFLHQANMASLRCLFPFGYLEDLPRMSSAEKTILRNRMRDLYAVHHSAIADVKTANDDSLNDDDAHGDGGEQTPPPDPTEPPSGGGGPNKSPPGHVDTTPSDKL